MIESAAKFVYLVQEDAGQLLAHEDNITNISCNMPIKAIKTRMIRIFITAYEKNKNENLNFDEKDIHKFEEKEWLPKCFSVLFKLGDKPDHVELRTNLESLFAACPGDLVFKNISINNPAKEDAHKVVIDQHCTNTFKEKEEHYEK